MDVEHVRAVGAELPQEGRECGAPKGAEKSFKAENERSMPSGALEVSRASRRRVLFEGTLGVNTSKDSRVAGGADSYSVFADTIFSKSRSGLGLEDKQY